MKSAKGYSAKATPLTNLLKKNRAWQWADKCQRAFEELKKVISKDLVLVLPDHTEEFEVHTDASDFDIPLPSGATIHRPGKGNDNHHSLFSSMATLLAWCNFRHHDRQRCDKLLLDTEKAQPQASTMARLPGGILLSA
ncbi:hypothetical protein LWI28_014577 [Acer negundo]|uniref:Reverse transcriptase/retrotransposon-derived protein RNase H-like domain-containing protein n=1 Tax=Acer negundo TaxID=4023 RepID=A0AAD5IE78_ACENE|nr:hypothetical protein LWI28_014577 [Acer negundo]